MLFPPPIQEGLSLAARLDPQYAPAWQGRPATEQAALAMYFLPHRSSKAVLKVTRPRMLKWYCPFADQRYFPSGHRYCINVYTGCSHGCVYCYAAGYLAMNAKPKAGFRRGLMMDLDDLDEFDVPPAPVHLSNSTDPLQIPLEAEHGDTLFALRYIARRRHRFTTVTILTKNPTLLTRDDYLDALANLERVGRPVVVEVSIAFWREAVAAAYDPGAPTIAERLDAIRRLRSGGVRTIIRVSPTYPIGINCPDGDCPQTIEDMRELAGFAAEVGVKKMVYTPAKIVRPKFGKMNELMQAMLVEYRRLSSADGVEFRGGSWRLPHHVANQVVIEPLQAICAQAGIKVEACVPHLLGTK